MTLAFKRLEAVEHHLLPEFSATLDPLVAEGRIAAGLPFPEAVRLSGEAEALAADLERIADARRFGSGGNAVDPDLADRLHALRRDAAALLRRADAQLLAAAQQAADAAEDQPLDLTATFRKYPPSASATVEDRAIPTGFSASGEFGHVGGEFSALVQDAPDGSAPREAMILPSGCMIRLEAGERLRLYAQGWSEGNGTRIPSRTMLTCILLEGKGAGAGIQGPAVIAPAPPAADAGARKGLRARFASLADANAKRLQSEKACFSSLAAIPASYIVAGPDRRVRVMRPLPALSAPPNVVRLEDRRPA